MWLIGGGNGNSFLDGRNATVNGRASAGSANGNPVIRGADALTDIAMDALTACPACGYPKFGPDLCAYCRPERVL